MNKMMVAREILKVAKELLAIEFPTQDAMKKYLDEHPDADKSNHKVVETKKDEPKKEEKKPESDKPANKKDVVRKKINEFVGEHGDAALDVGYAIMNVRKVWNEVVGKLPKNPTQKQWDKAWSSAKPEEADRRTWYAAVAVYGEDWREFTGDYDEFTEVPKETVWDAYELVQEEEQTNKKEEKASMNKMMVAAELVKLAKMLSGDWQPVRRDVDVGLRNVQVKDSLTSYAPRITAIVKNEAVKFLGAQEIRVRPADLIRVWSKYLAMVDAEINANKYHYYVVFSFESTSGTQFIALNCSGRIGIVERTYDLTDKFLGGPADNMDSAIGAAEKHMSTKVSKGYQLMPMVRG